jgi:hypothetical protein
MAGRNYEIRIKVSKEEYETIKKKCLDACMPMSSFLRYLALNSTLRVTSKEY